MTDDKDPFGFDIYVIIGFAIIAAVAAPFVLFFAMFVARMLLDSDWLVERIIPMFARSMLVVMIGGAVGWVIITILSAFGDGRGSGGGSGGVGGGGGRGHGGSSSRAENLRPKHIQLRNALYSAQMSAETYAGPQPNPWALEVRDIEAELRLLESEMASGAAAQDGRLDRLRSKHNHLRSKYVRTLQQAMVYQGSGPNPYTIDARQMQAEMGMLEAEIARLR